MARNSTQIVNQVITGTGADAASRPSVAFGDTDTGFFESEDDKISVTLGGTERFHFSGSELTKADGTKFITSATLSPNSVGNTELSGQILWSKLANGTQGQVAYVNSQSQISGLAVGTSGQVLTTQGASADPIWTTVASSSTGIQRRYTFSGSFGTGTNGWLGAYRVPANDLISGQVVVVRGIVHGDSDGATKFSISGTAIAHVSVTHADGNPQNVVFSCGQGKVNTQALAALSCNSTHGSTVSATVGGAEWFTNGNWWISGSHLSNTATSHAKLELWY